MKSAREYDEERKNRLRKKLADKREELTEINKTLRGIHNQKAHIVRSILSVRRELEE